MSAWRHADIRSLRVLGSLPLAPPPLSIRGDGYFCSVATVVPLGRLAAMLAAGFGFRCIVARFGKCIGLVISKYVLSVTTLAEQVAAFCGTVRWTESCKLVSLEVSSGNHSGNHMYRLL